MHSLLLNWIKVNHSAIRLPHLHLLADYCWRINWWLNWGLTPCVFFWSRRRRHESYVVVGFREKLNVVVLRGRDGPASCDLGFCFLVLHNKSGCCQRRKLLLLFIHLRIENIVTNIGFLCNNIRHYLFRLFVIIMNRYSEDMVSRSILHENIDSSHIVLVLNANVFGRLYPRHFI